MRVKRVIILKNHNSLILFCGKSLSWIGFKIKNLFCFKSSGFIVKGYYFYQFDWYNKISIS